MPALASQCEVCRQWSPGGAGNALCVDCVQRFAAPVQRCARCALRTGLATPACGACLRDPPPFEHTLCAADYGFPWDDLVADFKFHGRPELAPTLAARLLAAVRQHPAWPLPQWLLPVPLSTQRLQARGYNQAWELTRPLAVALQIPADPQLLLRHLDTAHQADLGRAERRRNLRAAFMVDPRRRALLQGRRVALVDDVMTTGTTAREAAATLLRAGAAAVDIWVLARTPDAA